jgi:hypothetical protein
MYGTTKEFLLYFGLPNLAALPTLKEFSEISEQESEEEIEAELEEPLLVPILDEIPAEESSLVAVEATSS